MITFIIIMLSASLLSIFFKAGELRDGNDLLGWLIVMGAYIIAIVFASKLY